MRPEQALQPRLLKDGRIKTLNHRGFTTPDPDPLSRRFIEFAAGCGHEVLDLGCAYGVATLPALNAGVRICACDMDPGHLTILESRAEPATRDRLSLISGAAPDVDFAPQRFGAILTSRVLHFLTGPDVDVTLAKMFSWLRPGGKLFIIVDTPYAGVLRQCVPQYLERKKRNERWPGFIADCTQYMPRGLIVDPPFANLMDRETLADACVRAGFFVEEIRYMPRIAKRHDADPQGRDHVGCIAVRPG